MDQLIEFVDIYPTLCELAGLTSKNKELQGTSFAPLLRAPNTPWKRAVFSKYGPALSVITDQFNYAEFKNGETMLYDLKQDPDENRNLAGDSDYAEQVKHLAKLLKAGWKNVLP